MELPNKSGDGLPPPPSGKKRKLNDGKSKAVSESQDANEDYVKDECRVRFNLSNSRVCQFLFDGQICMDGKINSVLLDCGHLCACVDCAKTLASCPVCRQRVRKVVKTFFC